MTQAVKKVLIVEDNSDWRELLSMIIKRLGYDVIAAMTGREGVALATLNQPDLILMDLGLPEMSGDEATAHIKANPVTQDIPIVIQSAFGAGPNAKHALEAGAAEIMQKPISITDIQAVLKKYLACEAYVRIPKKTCSISQPINITS